MTYNYFAAERMARETHSQRINEARDYNLWQKAVKQLRRSR